MTLDLIGVYGGTFDPIHLGHVQAASEVQRKLGMREVRMVLSATPPHRETPFLSAQKRFELLQLALKENSSLIADDIELERSGSSYMVDTLRLMRHQLPTTAIALILGIEAFNHLQSWYEWQELIELAHIVVTDRASFGNELNIELNAFVKKHETQELSQLKELTHGKIYRQNVTPFEVSATQIRSDIQQGISVADFLAPQVWQKIEQLNLYGTKKLILNNN